MSIPSFSCEGWGPVPAQISSLPSVIRSQFPSHLRGGDLLRGDLLRSPFPSILRGGAWSHHKSHNITFFKSSMDSGSCFTDLVKVSSTFLSVEIQEPQTAAKYQYLPEIWALESKGLLTLWGNCSSLFWNTMIPSTTKDH